MFNSQIPLRRLQASLSILLLIVFLSISQSLLINWQILPILGAVFIAIAVVIRTLSSLYIAGHKNRQLITQGPYSLSRNPLYVCWLFGSLGIGLAVNSLLLAFLLAIVIFVIYDKAIVIEEKRLLSYFPQEFKAYMSTTPRWIGRSSDINFRLSQKPSSSLTIKALFEGACLYLIYPINYIKNMLQDDGVLPSLLFYF